MALGAPSVAQAGYFEAVSGGYEYVYEGSRTFVSNAEYAEFRARVAYWGQLNAATPSPAPSEALRSAGNWTSQKAGNLSTALRTQTASGMNATRGLATNVLTKAKALPKWGVGALSSPVAVGASGLLLGWEVGGLIADVIGIGEEENPPPEARLAVEAMPVYEGFMMGNSAGASALARQDGFLLKPEEGANAWRFSEECVSPGPVVSPDGERHVYTLDGAYTTDPTKWHLYSPNGCFTAGYHRAVLFAPLKVKKMHGDGSATPQWSEDGVAPPTDQDALDGAEWCITNPVCAAFTDWFDEHDDVADPWSPHEEEEDPPLVVPPIDHDPEHPARSESFAHYADKLDGLGLEAEKVTLGETNYDPRLGPNQVARTNPQPGTEVEVGATVKVIVNPETAPWPNRPPPSETPPSPVDPVDPEIGAPPILCEKFPFGLFCWFYEGLTDWSSGASCPTFEFPFQHGDLPIDLCQFEPAMQVIRPILVIVAAFGMAFMVAGAAMGFNGGGGTDD